MGAAAIATAAVGAAKLGFGIYQYAKGKKMAKGLKAPTYTPQGEIKENAMRARVDASTGLPAEQYTQAMQNINRQQSMIARQANSRRMGLMSAMSSARMANDATLNLDVADANMRMRKSAMFMQANKDLASAKDQAWSWNKQQSYLRDYGYAMGLQGMGVKNIAGAADGVLSAASFGVFDKK